jgi:hypothetical protein
MRFVPIRQTVKVLCRNVADRIQKRNFTYFITFLCKQLYYNHIKQLQYSTYALSFSFIA